MSIIMHSLYRGQKLRLKSSRVHNQYLQEVRNLVEHNLDFFFFFQAVLLLLVLCFHFKAIALVGINPYFCSLQY